jgi:hypothetical protein
MIVGIDDHIPRITDTKSAGTQLCPIHNIQRTSGDLDIPPIANSTQQNIFDVAGVIKSNGSWSINGDAAIDCLPINSCRLVRSLLATRELIPLSNSSSVTPIFNIRKEP